MKQFIKAATLYGDVLEEKTSITVNGKTWTSSGSISYNNGEVSSGADLSNYIHMGSSAAKLPEYSNIRFASNVSSSDITRCRTMLATAKRYLESKNVGWLFNVSILFHYWDGTGWYTSNDFVELNPDYLSVETTLHELGHRFHYQCTNTHAFNAEVDAKYEYYMKYDNRAFWRTYGRKDRYEFWADTFRHWVMSDLGTVPQAAWANEMIQKYNR